MVSLCSRLLFPCRLAVLIGVASLPAACAQSAAPVPRDPPATLANPAAVACVRQGGTVVIRRRPEGEVGYCRLPDGRNCEEWALFRDGRCVPPP